MQVLAPALETDDRMIAATGIVPAVGLLRAQRFALVLLDLSCVEDDDQASLKALQMASPATAIMALSLGGDEARARATLSLGAQDYVLASDIDPRLLPRMMRSAIERKHHDDVRADLERRASITLDSIGDAVLSTDTDGRVTYLNQVAETMTGWTYAEAFGQPLAQVFHIVDEATRQPAPDPLLRAVRENRAVELTGDCVLLGKGGHEYLIEDSAAPIRARNGEVSGAVIVFRDVGSARARERGLAHLAHHDFLTDLPNRLLFGERVDTAIVLARRHQRQAALLYLDLDGFKPINDTLGHGLGDMLLQSVTQRLVQSVRASDTICRQGGDEFVILLSEIDGPADAAASAGKLLRTLAEPHYIGGRELSLTASIGIALYPKDGREVVALLHRADSAMYEAKRRGRNQYQFFSLLVPDNSTPP